MSVKPGLGRGFDALIPEDVVIEKFDVTANIDDQVSALHEIKVEQIIQDEEQPRKEFNKESLDELAESIREYGVLQPITVIKKGEKYQIVSGERRWRASKIAGKETIPAIVRTLTGQQKLEQALIENLQREDLKPMEISTALLKMRTQSNMSPKEISKKIGKSEAVISNFMRLMKLPDFAKDAVADGKLSEGHARQVLALEAYPDAQKTLVDNIIKNDWSVRKAEQFVSAFKHSAKTDIKKAKKAVTQKSDFTVKLSKKIGLPVRQKITAKGGGQIIITYKSEKELQKLEKLF